MTQYYHDLGTKYYERKIVNSNSCIDIFYYKDGKTVKIETHLTNNLRHRIKEPAEITYRENGSVESKMFYTNGKKTLSQTFYENKMIQQEVQYNENEEIKSFKEFYDNGKDYIITKLKNGKYHCDDAPAIVILYENGKIKEQHYYINGVLHNKDKPAIVILYENGNVKEYHYYTNGFLYNGDRPAKITYYENKCIESEEYYIIFEDKFIKDGIEKTTTYNHLFREDKPAVIEYHENKIIKREVYYVLFKTNIDDSFTRMYRNSTDTIATTEKLDNPIIKSHRDIFITATSKIHREHLPAIIEYYPNGKIQKEYFIENGKKHRIGNNPAVVTYDIHKVIIDEEYYINGIEIENIQKCE